MVEDSLDMQIKIFWYSVYVKMIKIYFNKSSGSSSNLIVEVVVVVVVKVVTYLSDHEISK